MALRDTLLPVISRNWTQSVSTYEVGVDYGGRLLTLTRTAGDSGAPAFWRLYDGATLLASGIGQSPQDVAETLGRAEAAVATAVTTRSNALPITLGVLGGVAVLGLVLWVASK